MTISMTWIVTLLLVLARVGGIMFVAPIFSEMVVPVKLRVVLSFAIALAVAGRLVQPLGMPMDVLMLALAGAGELAIGAAVGYAARLVFVGVELGAMHVSQQMGVGLAEVYDAQADDSAGAARRLFVMLSLVLFLAIGGHRQLLSAVMRTFDTLPLGGFLSTPTLLGVSMVLLDACFALALKVAAPVLIALLLATVALGLLQRTVPQMHVFSTGFPIRAMLGLVVLAASLAALGPILESAWKAVAEQMDGAFVP